MSKPFQIFQEKSVGYDEEGHRSFSSTYYIKLDESAQGMLGKLKGARLSFFTCISLHEIAVLQRDEPPYTIAYIRDVTGYSERALQYAAPWLLAHGFAVVCGTTARGEKMYRPTDTYAWFGERGAKIALVPSNSKRGAKIALAPRGAKSAPPALQGCKKRQNGVQKTDTVVRRRDKLNSSDLPLSSSSVTAVQILTEAGLITADRDFANAVITEEHARAIADWIAHPTAQNKYIEDRASYARRCLLVSPSWQRPRDASEKQKPSELQRTDFSDTQWHRLHPTNRMDIISREKGIIWEETQDDPHYGCVHTVKNEVKPS
jgi:hypothetical protein